MAALVSKTRGRQRVAVVSHDAGGAEILSALVHQQGLMGQYVLEGPAKNIFARKLGRVPHATLEDAVGWADWVLCSTSWQSDLEFRATQLARSLEMHVVVFLDHWINYVGRLVRGADSLLPSELWVGDAAAAAMARAAFPSLPVEQGDNPYFLEIQSGLARVPPTARVASARLRVLYVGEVIDAFSKTLGGINGWAEPHGYTEEDALSYGLNHLEALGAPVEWVRIRPHPAEPKGKYSWAKERYQGLVRLGGTAPLLHEIVNCDVVLGCESMAMVVGLLAGKRVVSCVPPGGKPCVLPQPEIEHLQLLLSEIRRDKSASLVR